MGANGFYSADQVRELERRAMASGIAAHALMQRAAAALWRELTRAWPRAGAVAIVCGPGNNGGDGYELARLAAAAGWRVEVWEVAGAPRGTAAKARRGWLADGGKVRRWRKGAVERAPVIVDALFGIGLSRAIEGPALEAVAGINRARDGGAGVLAVDVPSGLDADRGGTTGAAVVADRTVSFIARKPGLHTGAGPDHAGAVVLDALDLPARAYRGMAGKVAALEPERLPALLPRRRPSAHKGDNGHVLVVGGDRGMGGAALLAARGALRAGAGLVSVATHPFHAAALTAAQPELMVHPVEDAAGLRRLLERASVVAVGPGLGQDNWGRDLWSQVAGARLPMVVDADALNWLADDPQRREDWVLTPHPGEAGRLLQRSTAQVQQDRLEAVQALAAGFGGVAVLKGTGTLVAGAELALCPRGSPAMAVGGMGDVLCGVIAGLMAQGLGAEQAAQAGVLSHALAGEQAGRDGARGTVPGDVLQPLRRLLNP